MRVARLAYTGGGTQRVTIRAAVLRHLERRGIRRLRAVLTPTGGKPIAITVRLART